MPAKKQKGSDKIVAQNAPRQERKTYAITQKGIGSDTDLFAFLNAALSDIDGGRTNMEEMRSMTSVTRQIIALQNLRLKAGVLKNRMRGEGFLLG